MKDTTRRRITIACQIVIHHAKRESVWSRGNANVILDSVENIVLVPAPLAPGDSDAPKSVIVKTEQTVTRSSVTVSVQVDSVENDVKRSVRMINGDRIV